MIEREQLLQDMRHAGARWRKHEPHDGAWPNTLLYALHVVAYPHILSCKKGDTVTGKMIVETMQQVHTETLTEDRAHFESVCRAQKPSCWGWIRSFFRALFSP